MFDKEKYFWDKKIIQWENGRYLNKNDFLLEKVSDYFSNSLKFRRKKSLDFLKKIDVSNNSSLNGLKSSYWPPPRAIIIKVTL